MNKFTHVTKIVGSTIPSYIANWLLKNDARNLSNREMGRQINVDMKATHNTSLVYAVYETNACGQAMGVYRSEGERMFCKHMSHEMRNVKEITYYSGPNAGLVCAYDVSKGIRKNVVKDGKRVYMLTEDAILHEKLQELEVSYVKEVKRNEILMKLMSDFSEGMKQLTSI
jgi:hypothetical protein